MKLHWLQHVEFEKLGSINDWAVNACDSITCTRLWAGDELPEEHDYNLLVVMGGPMNIYEYDKYPWLKDEKRYIKEAIDQNKIVLGVCLGAQLIADVLGGEVVPGEYKEIGWFDVSRRGGIEVDGCDFLPETLRAFHWHGDTFSIPECSVPLYQSEACANQAFIYKDRVVGLQFHLEVKRNSIDMLISNCKDEIVDGKYIQSIDQIRKNENIRQCNFVMDKLLKYLCLKSNVVKIEKTKCNCSKFCPSVKACPVDAISQDGKNIPVINQKICIKCGACISFCSLNAIERI